MSELDSSKVLYNRVAPIIEGAKNKILKTINQEIVKAYWEIGKEILEEEQKGRDRAKYGQALIENLSIQLTKNFGKGFTKRNLWQMRKFYETYPIMHAVRAQLTWTHYRLLISIEEQDKRSLRHCALC